MVDHYDFDQEELANMSARDRMRLGLVPSTQSDYTSRATAVQAANPLYSYQVTNALADLPQPPNQIEFLCRGCGETFCDNDYNSVSIIEHYQKEDGTRCGSTQVELKGTWHAGT